MPGFADAFNDYLNEDVSDLFDDPASDLSSRTFVELPEDLTDGTIATGTATQFMFRRESSRSRSSSIDSLAKSLLDDPDDAAAYLDSIKTTATSEPYKAFGILSTFGDVIKHLIARIRRVPEKLGVVFEKLRGAVAAVAKVLKAATYSVNLDLPWSFGIGISWTPS